MVRHLGPGLAPDIQMFGDLVRIVAEHGLAVPPEIADVFRALATPRSSAPSRSTTSRRSRSPTCSSTA